MIRHGQTRGVIARRVDPVARGELLDGGALKCRVRPQVLLRDERGYVGLKDIPIGKRNCMYNAKSRY